MKESPPSCGCCVINSITGGILQVMAPNSFRDFFTHPSSSEEQLLSPPPPPLLSQLLRTFRHSRTKYWEYGSSRSFQEVWIDRMRLRSAEALVEKSKHTSHSHPYVCPFISRGQSSDGQRQFVTKNHPLEVNIHLSSLEFHASFKIFQTQDQQQRQCTP